MSDGRPGGSAGTRRSGSTTGAAELGERFGPLWATYWFRLRVDSAGRVARAPRRPALVLATARRRCGATAASVQGLNVHHRDAVLAEEARAGASRRARGRARVQRPVRRAALAPVELRSASSRSSTRRRGGCYFDFETLRALEAEEDSTTRWAGELRAELDRFCNEWDSGNPRGALRAHERDARARARGDRPRAHRHGVALAARRDLPQVRAHVHDRHSATWRNTRSTASRARRRSSTRGSRSATPICGSASAHAGRRRASSSPSAAAGSSPTATSRRANRSCASSSTASASSSSEFGRRCTRVLEPRRVRLRGPAAADHARGRDHALPDAEALVEPLQAARAPHVRRGRGSTAARCSATSRRRTPTTSEATVAELREDVARSTSTTSTRGRACSSSATATAAAARRGRCSRRCGARATCRACRARACDERGVLRRARGRARRAARRRRRAVLRVPPRHVHDAGARRSAATAAASRRCTTPSSSPSRAAASTRAPSSTGSGSCCSCSSSTTSSRARRSARLRGRASATSPRSRPARRRSARRAATRSVNTIGVRTPRGRRRSGRRARLRRGAAVRRRSRRSSRATRSRVDGLDARERAPARDALAETERVSSSFDKATGRETLAAPGNRLELYDDRPVEFDAWDIDPFHLETRARLRPADVVTRSVTRRCAPRSRSSARSASEPTDADRPARRRFAPARVPHEVDWHESHTLLKVCFPLAVPRRDGDLRDAVRLRRAADALLDELRRARARGARPPLADLSEHGFGAALLTD